MLFFEKGLSNIRLIKVEMTKAKTAARKPRGQRRRFKKVAVFALRQLNCSACFIRKITFFFRFSGF